MYIHAYFTRKIAIIADTIVMIDRSKDFSWEPFDCRQADYPAAKNLDYQSRCLMVNVSNLPLRY